MTTARILTLGVILFTVFLGVMLWDCASEEIKRRKLKENYEGPLGGW